MQKDYTTQSITVHRVLSTEEFQGLESEWKNLLQASNHHSAFLSWEWLFSWWQIFQKDNQLWLLTARENQDLVAIMPLMVSRQKKNGITFRVLHPLGSPQCDVSGIIVSNSHEGVFKSLGEFIIANKNLWDVLELNHYLHDDVSLRNLKLFLNGEGFITIEKEYDHFYIPIEGEWDCFINNLSKKFRKNLRRASRLISDSGQVTFDHYSGEEASWPVFQKVMGINQHANYPLVYKSKEEQELHKLLLERMAGTKMLTIFLLSLNDSPVAYEYGFLYNGKYEAWRAGYDTRLDPIISVGKLLFSLLVERAFLFRFKEIDFLRGDEPYKLEWKPLARKYTKNRFIHKDNILGQFSYIWLPRWKSLLKPPSVKNSTDTV